MAKRLIIVASMKGGVGKTTEATFLVDAFRGAAVLGKAPSEVRQKSAYGGLMELLEKAAGEVLPIDVDVEPGNKEGTSSLYRRIKGTIPYPVAPTDAEIMDDARTLCSHYDKLHNLVLGAPDVVVMDVGAGVINTWLRWAEQSEAAIDWARHGVVVTFVAVTTAEHAAFAVAADGLERMDEICREHGAPFRGYVVLNRWGGKFDRYEGTPEWERLRRLGDVAEPIYMPVNLSELREFVDVSTLAPSEVLSMTESDLLEAFPALQPLQARRGQNQYMHWYQEILEDTIKAGLLGKQLVLEDEAALS